MLVRAAALSLFLFSPTRAAAIIAWDSVNVQVANDVADPGNPSSVREIFQVHVSPGGTVFYTWMDFSGVLSDSTRPDSLFRCCDGRKAFASNGLCPSYENEYECIIPPLDPETCPPCEEPLACRYYYLPRAIPSIYVRLRYPDGNLGPIEEVTPVNHDSLTAPFLYDAAVGPDGSLHVVWEDVVPNVPVGLAPYSEARTPAASLPLQSPDDIMYNLCGRDVDNDGDPDSVTWIIGPNDTVCQAGCSADCDEYDPSLASCIEGVGCWRQLASLSVVCYRRRSPTGTWGPIHRHIAPYTDVYAPDTLRTCRVPVVAVDSEGWVYVAWDQKAIDYPSCAWRRLFSRGRGGFGPGGSQSAGFFNMGQYDCYFRKWSSVTHPEGPDETSIVYKVSEADTFPDEMPQDPREYHTFQDDAPWDIMVIGAGASATVHLIVAQAPSIGSVCASGIDFFSDCDLYTYLAPESTSWAPRQQVTRAPKALYGCNDSCSAEPDTLLHFEMHLTHFVKNSAGPVHVLYDVSDYLKLTQSCECGSYVNSCFSTYGREVFYRQIVPGDPEAWTPPYSEEGLRVSVYEGDSALWKPDGLPVGVIASDGSMHAFWVADDYHVLHSGFDGAFPDTVMTFAGSSPIIGGIDIAERNGIFHLLVGGGEPATLAPDEELPSPNAQNTALYYKRGVLAPEAPDTIVCTQNPGTWIGNTVTWADTITLCGSFEVKPCSTLVVQAGTQVLVVPPGNQVDPQVEITVRGKLICQGTAQNPVVFRSIRTPERATIGDWQGIYLKGPSARARLEYTTISGAVEGIRDVNLTASAPSACTNGDSIPAATLRIENCNFRYNEIAGVYVKGNNSTNTPDLVRVAESEFRTNLKGLIIENASAPDGTSGYVVRGNQFLYNDMVAIEIRGKYGRTVVIDSNLVQGLGEDELIDQFPDTAHPDNGLWYDESVDAVNGDTITVSRNTFYRIQDVGLRLDMLPESIPGNGKSQVALGQETESYGNFLYRVGTGIRYANNKGGRFVAANNMIVHYGTGFWTDSKVPKIGSPDGGGNFFDNCITDSLTPPFFSGFHVVAVLADTAKKESLYVDNNYWCPVSFALPNKCYNTGDFSIESPDTMFISPCVGAGGNVTALELLPAFDRFSVLNLPLKKPLGASGAQIAPRAFRLYPCQPNPFNPRTVIRFDVPSPVAFAELNVYDAQGRVVAELVRAPLSAGTHSAVWNAEAGGRGSAASGVYFYRLKAGRFDETRKMVLVR